ncbi:hypothetical protein DPMN_128082 [Dreissena polymorpha]|uniref:Uncharacterized protein n=1 Tax=Dreissena polymorpha TaxID=45954 RepID=A0A9D4GYS9_DREPO|nr:hypothetical protein DPMN_128082 [Dreissena polymorpha]
MASIENVEDSKQTNEPTSIGELSDERAVNPTISEKKTVTLSYVSGATIFPNFRSFAIDLINIRTNHKLWMH